ncbi:E3 ubiquitin-protein ligase HUWE1 [Hypsibius exemplaris]|uniref:HECT-type E3 ubiquitin transferase n=1 Tax=Hypsibius exemplaris TaxID=2072580 RepID=A0A1W0WDW2_HYPEX|nr:E3 ubiquitin-protein ligase HUWE1 [Hypsibius exemplaris]
MREVGKGKGRGSAPPWKFLSASAAWSSLEIPQRVKFCVNPARPRRHAVGARGEVPSGHARSVATTISSLITQVINRKGPIANPSLRLRLQYLYYAMFMIQPLLFDEKRFAYHFMLQKFISTGTIDAFFGAFKPVLKGPTGDVELTGPNADKAAGCIVEFAISWLSLLERLLSPKNILESPNTLPISRIPISGYVAPFDPVPYYIEMLHSTLQVIDKLLSLQALKNFGEQTGDLLLTILSHVMKIEAIIKEKTVGTATAPVTSSDTTAASAAAAAAAGGASAAAAPPQPAAAAVPPAALQSLLDMGFTPEASAEALVYHANNVEQAADYLLAGQADRVMRAGGMRVLDMDADANEDELMSQAIAMSIGERLPGTGEASADGSAAALPRVPVLIAPSSQQIEALINRALPLCIDLVDFAPECVFKVADLITVISKRNGSDWRVKLIKTLAKDAVALATSVIQTADRFYSGEVQPPADTSAVDVLRAAPESLKLSARLHLLCILIQENQEECGAILESDSLVPLLISLISAARRIHGLAERGSELAPKWLAFAYLILDSYEKICAAARRRRLIREKYANTWRWLDVRLGKWTPYCDQNNREISEAYDKGLATCKLSGPGAGPQRSLVIRFKDMVQMTDATGSRRPIMRDLLKKPKTSETAAAALATDSLATEMPKNTDDKSPSARPPVLLATDNNGSPMQTDQDVPEEKVPVAAVAPATLNGLLPEQKRAIISDTVSLIHQKLDGDTLQAAMRILLRLTRDYEMAQLFAELKGPQILFGLDRRSMFESFTSFLTHLIRHIIENNSLLDYSMEKFCSWLTYGVVSSVAGTSFGCQAVREGNYVMRVAWPGAARHSEKFIECARKSLRLNTPTGSAAAAAARAEDPNQRADCVKPCPPKRNNSIGQEQPEAYCNILRQLIADLLDLLIAPWEPECKKVVLPAKDTSTKDSSPVTASATTSQRQQNNLQPLLQEQADELKRLGAGGSADSDQTLWKLSDKASRPVLKKSMVLRMLAELVKSYNHVATYILAHSYHADQSPLVKEDIGSLGFILDNFVHVGQKAGDDYCQYSARVLMAALAASFENVPAEMQVVEEVKQALQRATILPESQEKHERIGALANIIHTMVEACPTRVADPSGDRSIQFLPNTICKFMAKRNLINDLAKIPHSLDLRSPYLAATINFVLRPLEVLTRIASQPEKPKARPAKVGVGAVTSHAHTARTTTAGNADASDVTPMSGQDESQRTENDVAPIADDMNIAEGADLNDLYFMTPAMDVDTDNQQVTSEGEDDEPVQRPERRNRLRNNRELDISMEEDNSENEDDIQEQLRPSGGGVGGLIADEDPAEADEDEEMQDEEEDEDDEEDDEEEDEEEDEEDDFIEHAPLQHHHNHDGGEEFRGFPGYRAAFDGGDWGDDDHTFDEDMLAHLEDLFPGAALTHGLDPHGPLLLELTAGNGPGAIGQELQNGSTGTRQPPPPLAISSSHPLLARPPPVLDPSQLAPTTGGAAARLGMGHSDTAMNARGSRVMRIRSGQLTARMGGGGGGHARMALGPPAILARLLGPAFQLYPGDPMAMMAGHGGAIRQGRHPAGEPATYWDHDYGTAGGTRLGEQEDLMLVDDPIFLGTNGLVNSLPSLVRRWSEEARVLDGENVIECADVVRAFILPELEEIRDASIAQNRKDNPEASVTTTPSTSTSQRHLQTARRSYRPSTASADGLGQRLAAAAAESSALQGDAASSHASILDDLSLIEESAGIAALGQAVAARMAQEMDQSDSDESEEDYSSHLSEDTDGDLPDAVIDMVRNRVLAADPMDLVEAPTDAGAVLAPPGDAAPPPTAADTAPAAAPTAEHPATAAADAATTPASAESVGVQPVIATPAADAPVPGQATMNATSAPGTSTATASSVDTGYPEGIDPSFLEALPENMRQEVIADFMRMQRQQRAAQEREARAAAGPAAATAATGTADSGVVSAAGSSAGTASASSAFDINPEFLAALPPNIQEEVLAQQRAEQARVAAQTAAPDAPFDPANFIQSLAPSLRRQILADIDDTLLTVLPDNVAQEARTLRNEVAHRHIFAHHGMPGGGGGAIGGAGGGAGMAFDGDVIAFMRGRFPTLRRGGAAPRPYSGNFATRGGAGGSRGLRIRSRTQNASRDGGWLNGGAPRSAWDYGGPLDAEGGALMRVGDIDCSSRVTSRPILDYEGLTCVLVLYFLNSPSINIGRVQRIFRNICHHASTREWVLDSVMSMLRKADESAAQGAKRVHTVAKPNWLNISIDAALGCRANVFQLVPRQLKRPHTLPAPGITIHPQAAQIVCGNLIDCLMLLAKNFPEQFVPYSIKTGDREKDTPTTRPPPKSPVRSAPRTPAGAGGSSRSSPQDFWDILVRLDTQVGCGVRKTVKASGKQVSAAGPMHVVELGPDEPLRMVEFAASGLGQLIMMLQSDIFQKIPDLSDRLLRLVSSIAISVHKRDLGVPVSERRSDEGLREDHHSAWQADPQRTRPGLVEGGHHAKLDPACDANELKDQVSNLAVDLCNLSTPGAIRFSLTVESEQATEIEHLLRQLVNVLIARRCSEEGLEDITHTLIVLAQRMGTSVRQSIGQMLLDGIKQLAREVSGQIETLMREAVAYNAMKAREKAEEQDSESADATGESSAKGVLADRFTSGETVVLYKSKGKSQGSSEVHLPGMTQLTGKSSCQTFMLKLLKVIIDLRGTARISLRSKSGDKSDTCPNGTVNSIARRLLEMSYRHRQNKVRGISTDTPMDVDIPPLEGATPTPSASISGSSVAGTEEGSTAVTSDPESIRLGPGLAPPPPPRPGWVDSAALEIDLPALSELLNVEDLWTYLSACLGELERTGDQNAVLILQPTVESFFLVHAKEKQNADRREHATRRQAADVPPGSVAVEELAPAGGPGESASLAGEPASLVGEQAAIPSDLPMDVQKFLRFAETHKVVLNQILRQSTQALTEGPFAVLVDHTRVLDFDVKRKYFRHELDRVDQHRMRREDLALRIRRAHVFEDSFRDLHRRVAEDWKARFYIMFEGEEGQDAGGLLREWYSIISRDIFNPNYALFKTSPGDRVTYMINSYSHINSNHLSYFKFVGRLIAKAIYDNKLLDCYFTRSFYKHILGKPVKYTDMESEDYSFYQGLVYLLNHPVEEVGSELSFSMEVQEFGETKVKDLIPNGEKIPVTNENKHDYVRLACQMRMTHSIREQLDSFLAGFYEVIPVRLISIFNEQELELLISGLPNIDVDDLKANTDYHKYQLTSLQIQWFWRAIRSFDQADRAKFLQFVTGTSKVPLQGFAALEGMSGAQKFQIHRDDRSTDRLPSAHTCFNQLDLPAYETYDKLRTMLSTAIHECSEGFGFA